MKILHLSPSLSRKGGGVFEVERCLSHELDQRDGISVEAAGLIDDFSEADRPSWGQIRTTFFPVAGPRAFGYSPGLSRWLRNSDHDVIHLHGLWMYTSIATDAWSQRHSRPFIVTPHGMLEPWALKNSAWKKQLARRLYEEQMLRRASCLHAFTENEAADFRRYGLTNPIAIIPNGVSLPASISYEERNHRPEKLLFLGRLHKKKGLENLIRGWNLAKKSMGHWRLEIAGWDDGGHEATIRTLVTALGLTDQIKFIGPTFGEHKKTLFQSSTAFVLPSLSEGLPIAVLEAWSYGLPVMMTENCNLPIGFSTQAAIRIESTPESIAMGLSQLASMTCEEHRSMGMRGRQLVSDSFTWEIVANDLMQVYQWILGNGPKPACVRIE